MSELVELASVLGIKIDTHSTKLYLFDVVDGRFHLLGTTEADTSQKPPFNDIREGFFTAIDQLQKITGRILLDEEMSLIVPSQEDGSGIDQVAITFGFLKQVSMLTVGLLDVISIDSLSKIINNTHLSHVDQIKLNDPRRLDDILSTFVSSNPDIVMLAGGTDGGANKSVIRMLEIIQFCIQQLPNEKVPELIYAGNASISELIQEKTQGMSKLTIADNIRPALETENLIPALKVINEINGQLLAKKLPGFEYLYNYTKSTPTPTTQALGIITTFLSKLSGDNNTNILAIDLNKEVISFSGQYKNQLHSIASKNPIYWDFGKYLTNLNFDDFSRWMIVKNDDEFTRNYLWSKLIRPETVPEDVKGFSVELNLLREIIHRQYQNFKKASAISNNNWSQIVINGDQLSRIENNSEIALLLLDSIQPQGITNLFLDQQGILPILGSIALENPILPIQILEGTNISLIAKIISIQSRAKVGTPLIKIRIEYQDGTYIEDEIIKGTISKFSFSIGKIVKVFLEPISYIDMQQFGKNIEKGILVQGSQCGLIVDARGRPLHLETSKSKNLELISSWRRSMNINLA